MERAIPRLGSKIPSPPPRRLPAQLEYPPTESAVTQLPVHEDLLAERAKADFAVRDLTYILHGGKDNFEKFEHYRAILESDPVLAQTADKIRSVFLPRKEQYLNGLRTIKRLKELRIKHGWTRAELDFAYTALAITLPITQSDGLFKNVIATNGSDEQVNEWFALADNWNMLGSYGQTELGHGSNIAGVETLATYDPKTQTFDIHSPTLTSAKFWPGGLAITGSHSVVYAQLVLPGGKRAGVMYFFVQLRDTETGEPLKGIRTMDLGPKMAYATADNGFCYFDHVKVPLSAMLSKAASLSADGTFTRNPKYDSRQHYATMLLGRVSIGSNYGMCLGSGVTIATRYTCIRRQFGNDGNGKELKVLDYPSMQQRVLVPLAASFAFHFAGQALIRVAEPLTRNDYSMLQELHAASSCLKVAGAFYTTGALEELRRAQGGMGFSLLSGMPVFVGQIARLNTVEGDNYVLSQQTARWLLKEVAPLLSPKKKAGEANKPVKLSQTIAYLDRLPNLDSERCPATKRSDFRNPQIQVHAIAHWALRSLKDLFDEVQGQGKQLTDSLLLVDPCAVSHALYLVANYFNQDLDKMDSGTHEAEEYLKSSPSLRKIFRQLQSLFNLSLLTVAVTPLSHITTPATVLLADGYLTGEQYGWIKSEIGDLLKEVRPNRWGWSMAGVSAIANWGRSRDGTMGDVTRVCKTF